jgi:hypothetical protein
MIHKEYESKYPAEKKMLAIFLKELVINTN